MMRTRRIGIAVLICAALTLIGGGAFADVPTQFTYQGKLTDNTGQPVADGSYSMDFALCLDPSGSDTVWDERRTVQVTDGLFTVNLGEVNPIPATAFSGERWLYVRVDGVELNPRPKLTTAPYAFRAHTAEHVLDSAAVTRLNDLAGSVKLFAGENISIEADGNTLIFSGLSIPDPLPVSQSGAWNVGISGTPWVNVSSLPVVSISGTQNTVKSEQSGTWNVGITGEPTVAISSTTNTVKTATTSSSYKLFSDNQTIANGSYIDTSQFDCSGFRDLRGVIRLFSHSGNLENLKLEVYFRVPYVSSLRVGMFDFATPSESITSSANFVATSNWCIFTIPVMGSNVTLRIANNTGSSVTIHQYSYIYLVN